LGPSRDIETTVLFPTSPDRRQFVLGDIITVLLGVKNNGQDPLNISHIGCSLYSPYEVNRIWQNVRPHAELFS